MFREIPHTLPLTYPNLNSAPPHHKLVSYVLDCNCIYQLPYPGHRIYTLSGKLASVIGQVLFLSQDGKAPVSISLTGTFTETLLLIMHTGYLISLSNHDRVTAECRKRISAVYASVEIEPVISGNPQALDKLGSTFAAIIN